MCLINSYHHSLLYYIFGVEPIFNEQSDNDPTNDSKTSYQEFLPKHNTFTTVDLNGDINNNTNDNTNNNINNPMFMRR